VWAIFKANAGGRVGFKATGVQLLTECVSIETAFEKKGGSIDPHTIVSGQPSDEVKGELNRIVTKR
jgi:hypothetical protein